MKQALVLLSHGTVETLDQLPAFLRTIRRGREAPPSLLEEVTRRYEAIGGCSPLGHINREVATRLEAVLGIPVRLAFRLALPFPREALDSLAEEGIEQVAMIPLAQHSGWVYRAAMEEAVAQRVAAGHPPLPLRCSDNWGQEPGLTQAFAAKLRASWQALTPEEQKHTAVILTAHSLPISVVQGGDPYPSEVQQSAQAIVQAVGDPNLAYTVAFQSQGLGNGPDGKPMAWLGPTLESAIADAATQGKCRVLVAPVGFLCDHVEILYDLDHEARAWAESAGLAFSRTESLNADDSLIAVLATVGRRLLHPEGSASCRM